MSRETLKGNMSMHISKFKNILFINAHGNRNFFITLTKRYFFIAYCSDVTVHFGSSFEIVDNKQFVYYKLFSSFVF